MEGVNQTLALLLIIFSFLFLIYSLYKRYLPLKNARPYKFEPNLRERFKILLRFVFLQNRMFKDKYAALYHIFIFYGFLVFSLKSLSLILSGFGIYLKVQNFGIYQFSKDIFIFLVLLGIFLSVLSFLFLTHSCFIIIIHSGKLHKTNNKNLAIALRYGTVAIPLCMYLKLYKKPKLINSLNAPLL